MKEILRITFPVGSRLPMLCHEEMEYEDWKIPANVSKNNNEIESLTFSTPPQNPSFNIERVLDRNLRQPPHPPLRPRSLPLTPRIPARAVARQRAPHRRKTVQRRIWEGRPRMSWKRVCFLPLINFPSSTIHHPPSIYLTKHKKSRFATQLVQLTLCTLIQRFAFQLVDTTWERDVAVSRESILTAPAFQSKGPRLSIVGSRRAGRT